jgi:hypothetical protein
LPAGPATKIIPAFRKYAHDSTAHRAKPRNGNA